MTGGAICHLNISDRIPQVDYMMKLIRTAIKMGVVYFAINYNLQECSDGHISIGKNDNCPVCSKKITNNYILSVHNTQDETLTFDIKLNDDNFKIKRFEKFSLEAGKRAKKVLIIESVNDLNNIKTKNIPIFIEVYSQEKNYKVVKKLIFSKP